MLKGLINIKRLFCVIFCLAASGFCLAASVHAEDDIPTDPVMQDQITESAFTQTELESETILQTQIVTEAPTAEPTSQTSLQTTATTQSTAEENDIPTDAYVPEETYAPPAAEVTNVPYETDYQEQNQARSSESETSQNKTTKVSSATPAYMKLLFPIMAMIAIVLAAAIIIVVIWIKRKSKASDQQNSDGDEEEGVYDDDGNFYPGYYDENGTFIETRDGYYNSKGKFVKYDK